MGKNIENVVAVVTSRKLIKSGGIQTVTQTLFKGVCPIFFLEEEENIKEVLSGFKTILFSGFDKTFVDLVENMKSDGKKIAVFWHFASASEVDDGLGRAWRSLLPLLAEKKVDLFVTCKKGMDALATKLFKLPTFFIMNNSFDGLEHKSIQKEGVGLYSGSSDYWVKNLRPNLYGALMTGMHVDICPYEESLMETVSVLNMDNMVTGASRLCHEEFLKRMASREIVSYVTFSEGAPILPFECFNMGVVCVTSDNHHYYDDDSILKELVTCRRPDDAEAIYNAIVRAHENKAEILERHDAWKARYDATQRKNFEQFVKTLSEL